MAKRAVAGNVKLSVHAATGQWRKKIGIKPDKAGKRLVPAEFYFGNDFSAAVLKASNAIETWKAIKQDWKASYQDYAKSLFPKIKSDKPYWLPEMITAAHDEAVDKTESSQPMNVSIESAMRRYIAAQRARLGLMGKKGLKQSTFNTIEANLSRVFAVVYPADHAKAGAVILSLKRAIDAITYADIATLINQLYRKGDDGLSERTALNYARALQQFLSWMDEQHDLDFAKPKGLDGLFNLGKPTPKLYMPKMAEIKTLLTYTVNHPKWSDRGSEPDWRRIRLYVLLGINCGMYASDISSLTFDNWINFGGFPCLFWRRSKTTHQNTFHTLHWLFPETEALLQELAAPKANRHGRLLLNAAGELLEDSHEGYRSKSVSEAFAMLKSKVRVGEDLTFKTLRKFASNHIRQHTQFNRDDMARKFLGQRIPGVLRDYVVDDFDDLTKELQKFHESLKQAGAISKR